MKNGLTLVEVLIAAALVLIISVPLSETVITMLKSWQDVPLRTQLSREARMAQNSMKKIIVNGTNFLILDTNKDLIDDTLNVTNNGQNYSFYQAIDSKSGLPCLFQNRNNGQTLEILSNNCEAVEFDYPGANYFYLVTIKLKSQTEQVNETFGFSTRLGG